MWMLVMMVCLLDQNQAAPFPWQQSSLQPILQQQQDQTPPTLGPGVAQQKTSSSSSSSSSSVSSESSQSSEGPQEVRERQKLENAAVEQTDSSQESPSNSSLWFNELVLLGERAGERDREREMGDDSVESRESRALLLTFHHLLSPPGPDKRQLNVTLGETLGGATMTSVGRAGGEGAIREEGGVRDNEMETEFSQLLEDSRERADGMTVDSPGHTHRHGHHGNEAALELGL